MRENVKVLLSLVLIVAGIIAIVVWYHDRPTADIWRLRLGAPLVAVLSLGMILRLHLQPDLVPDYLRIRGSSYFNRDGFSFAMDVVSLDGIPHFLVFFQNQFDAPCTGTIGLRPACRFFLGRPKMDPIICRIDCGPPAAFGTARMPISIPQKLQGRQVWFEIGASADYFQGKGKRLRFHDGIRIRANSNFRDPFRTALVAAAAVTGAIVVFARPVSQRIHLPLETADQSIGAAKTEIITLWKLGDPPLIRHG